MDLPLVYRINIGLAAAYALLIPVIRGISSLDVMQSARCFSQSVALSGVILIVPVAGPELEPGVREIVLAKPWPYFKSMAIRFLTGSALSAFFIIGFACLMRLQKCTFPFWEFSGVTILYAGFMGSVGLAAALLGQNIIIGYLAALGYWTLCQMDMIKEGDFLYLFPVIDGQIQSGDTWKLLLAYLLCSAVFFQLVRNRTRGK